MASPDRGRLVYMSEPGELEILERPVPEAEAGGAVAEVVRANVCGSDVHIVGGEHPNSEPSVLGHEGVLRLIDLGGGVETDAAGRPVSEGDLVVPTYFQACRRCPHCGMGEYRLCANAYDHCSKPPDEPPHFHGTFATHYYLHPTVDFYKLPEGLDPAVAASANCATAQVLYGLDRLDVQAGETIVIQGAGGLGLHATAIADQRGAEVIVAEGADARLELATAFGADHTVDIGEYDSPEARIGRIESLTDGLGADKAVELTGVPDAFAEGPRLLRTGGRYAVMGTIVPGTAVRIDPGYLTRASITVEAIIRYQPWYLEKALRFLSEHRARYPYGRLLEDFTLANVEAAFDHSEARSVARASLVPEH